MDCIASELRNDVLERADVCPSLLLDFTLQVTSLDSTCASCSFNSHAWTRCIWTEKLGRSPSRHESIVTSNMESNSLQSVGCVGQVNLAYRYIQSNFRWSFVYFVKYCLNPSKKSNALHKPGSISTIGYIIESIHSWVVQWAGHLWFIWISTQYLKSILLWKSVDRLSSWLQTTNHLITSE